MGRLDAVDAQMAALVLIWGTAFVSIKHLSGVMDPFEIAWLRYVPFLLVFGIWILAARRQRLRALSGGDWWRVGLAGGFAVVGYHVPLNWAMSEGTPGEAITVGTAAIIVATTPLFVLFMTATAGQERITGAKGLGATLGFMGVIVIVLMGTSSQAEVRFVPKAWIALLAPLLWAGYNLLARPLIAVHGPLFITGLTMCIGTFAFVPFGIERGLEPLRGLTGLDWFWLAYLSMLATVGGYGIWNLALKRRTATEVAVFIYAIPVVATLAGVILLGERITPMFIVGAILVLSGLGIIQRARAAAKP